MYRFLFLALIAAVSAVIIEDGPCPSARPMADFDLHRYEGTWYEIARYPNAGEEGEKGKCTTAQYLANGNAGRARNTHIVAGIKAYIDGDIMLIEPGKILLRYTFGGRSKDSYITVLKTDYNNYSIAYSCKYFESTDTHQLFAWILSRSKVLDANSLAIVNNYVQASALVNSAKYILNDFSDGACTYNYVKEIQEFLD